MARAKSTTTKEVKDVEVKDIKEEVKEEKVTKTTEKDDIAEQLAKSEKEKADMMEMIKNLQAQMQILATQNNANNVVIKQNEDLTRTVKVTSLLNNVYNLSTQPRGKGKVFTFRKFGETKSIKFTDLQDILTIYKKDFEIGRAVLGTKKDYEDLQIGYIYDEVLSAKQMKDTIMLQDDKAIERILEMDIDGQDNIASLIAQRIVDGANDYDYNKIRTLEENGVAVNTFVDMFKEDKAKEDK